MTPMGENGLPLRVKVYWECIYPMRRLEKRDIGTNILMFIIVHWKRELDTVVLGKRIKHLWELTNKNKSVSSRLPSQWEKLEKRDIIRNILMFTVVLWERESNTHEKKCNKLSGQWETPYNNGYVVSRRFYQPANKSMHT